MANITKSIKWLVQRTPLWPMIRPRRIHVYGVGAPKTGTLSIARLFGYYRTMHEACPKVMVRLLKAQRGQHVTDEQIRTRLKELDHDRLECESAYYLAHVSSYLAELYPDALFIVTVRDPLPWLHSIINQCINNSRATMRQEYKALRDYCFGPIPDSYPSQQQILKEHGLHGLQGYLSYWATHYRTFCDQLPAKRTLFLKTEAISQSTSRIASFVGVPMSSLCQEKFLSHKTKRRHGVVDSMESSYVAAMVSNICDDVSDTLREHVDIQSP
jgi:hypothetical protein